MAIIVAGCSTAPSRFYSLASTSTADGTPPTTAAVMVGPVTIPAAVEISLSSVMQVAPNRGPRSTSSIDGSSPLSDSIAARCKRAISSCLLGTPEVANSQLAKLRPGLTESRSTCNASIQYKDKRRLWKRCGTVRKTAGGENPARAARSRREAVQGQGFDALAAAHSQADSKMKRRYTRQRSAPKPSRNLKA